MNSIFQSVLTNTAEGVSITAFIICMAVSLVLGLVIAGAHMYKNTYSKSFVMTIFLLPAIVQLVITLVNGNLGTGVAVMGAFSLVRFRSVPGTAREIGSIFMAMAVGLATGMGYIAVAIVFVIIMECAAVIITACGFGESPVYERSLRITIPESLDYTEVFEEIFAKYLTDWKMVSVKTSDMGSLYKLEYHINLSDCKDEKKMIDELRCRNGNLEIMCSQILNSAKEEL